MPKAFSSARLKRLDAVLSERVAAGEAAGAVVLLERKGQVHVAVSGAQDLASGAPMRRDSIFRVASMTKPVVAVAALSLVEEAKLRLDDPVDRFLPELAGRKVLRDPKGPLDDTVPAERALTLRDLLTFRAGIGTVFLNEGTYPLQTAILAAKIEASAVPHDRSPEEMLARYAALPMMHQPGTVWRYHNAYDLLGILVARVAGKPLEQVIAERITEPLGMTDTSFHVPDDKLDRLTTAYQWDRATKKLGHFGEGPSAPSHRTVRPAGAVGLFSTADDMLAFGQMMRHQGKQGRTRILARPTVEAMCTDQIPDAQKAVSPFFPGFWDHRGWGFGVSMVTRRTSPSASPGRFGWDGALGTTWYSDPREELTALLMTQRMGNPFTVPLNVDFATLVYQAIEDS
jgi:CubicO group peptidase (beta-lactamase class C family)